MNEEKIAVVGAGYVGLVAGACFSSFGYQVGIIETNPGKVDQLLQLKKGNIPIYEPGLTEIVMGSISTGNLSFHTEIAECLKKMQAAIVILAVGTPANDDGSCNLEYVFDSVRAVAASIERDTVLILKSTVPVGTAKKLKDLIASLNPKFKMSLVNNPEFLKEGSAISDFMRPERVVLGGTDEWAISKVRDLYNPLLNNGRPLFVTDHETAELAKLSANLMLASRISLINQVSRLSTSFGADIRQIEAILRSDSRIGNKYLYSGLGYGGSCFPKDVKDFIHLCKERDIDAQVAIAIDQFNDSQKVFFIEDIAKNFAKGATIALLGVAFKPETDDIRESPALTITTELTRRGYQIKAHDPKALKNYGEWLKQENITSGVTIVEKLQDALEGADAVILQAEWQEYQRLGMGMLPALFKGKKIYDGKNVWRKEQIAAWGFAYMGVGR